jgi:hypothetical protein
MFSICRYFGEAPLTDSNRRPLLTIEQRRGNRGPAGISRARKPRKKKETAEDE